MSSLHQEHHFESEICAHLAANGWLYEEGDAAKRVARMQACRNPGLAPGLRCASSGLPDLRNTGHTGIFAIRE
jgi:hypothetical protein